jgi:hypothetical protein
MALELITAQEAQWKARQRTYVNGLLESVIYPRIQDIASFGQYETNLDLSLFPGVTRETKTHLIGVLEKHGYKAFVKNDILKIEWK